MFLRRLVTSSSLASRSLSSTVQSRVGIPFVIDNEGKGERTYDIYSRLLRDRIVCLMTPVDDFIASALIAQLLFLQSESGKKPIHMYINSPGGSVTAGLAIYDTMQMISAPVATWVIGQASSMGSLLLAAGEKGMRSALPNARIMVHQPSGGAQGTCSDIVIRAEEITRLKKRLNEIYVHHTGISYDEIERTLDRDRFMSAQEALKFGLVDKIETHSGSMPSD
ncbi:hypothetical protein GCK72_004299 [Caenorhabditis remanei]|uniref:ATP-dependent Clp protease proteolytic subunit n=1 Tax=Caenorhabditis remanei TaxID=31234 RepID=A0A6A5HD92_CAERE|nr:hypothetical protein GCK72_004299 [Caenorhabditis remanei]KAF1764352.1 hypothetical protein GCK72_004299 [Caenorhabditis remanei]